MPDDRDGDGGDDGNVIYLPNVKNIEVFKNTPESRPAERSKPEPTEGRRWRPAIILAALAFTAAMLVATGPWGDLATLGDVAGPLGRDLLVLAAIAGVLMLGAAVARKKRPARQRELRRPRTRTREAPGDRLMELHVWCEFEIDHEPTMIEALETCLENLYDDEERQGWRG